MAPLPKPNIYWLVGHIVRLFPKSSGIKHVLIDSMIPIGVGWGGGGDKGRGKEGEQQINLAYW